MINQRSNLIILLSIVLFAGCTTTGEIDTIAPCAGKRIPVEYLADYQPCERKPINVIAMQ